MNRCSQTFAIIQATTFYTLVEVCVFQLQVFGNLIAFFKICV